MNQRILTPLKEQSIHQQIVACASAGNSFRDCLKNQEVERFFKGEKNETYAINQEGHSIFFTGLGNSPKPLDFYKAGKKLSETLGKYFNPERTKISGAEWSTIDLESFVIGLLSGAYSIDKKEESAVLNSNFQLHVKGFSEEQLQPLNTKIPAIVQGQFHCMDWLNKGANQKKPAAIVEFIKKLAAENDFEVEILDRQQARQQGLHAYLAVNQGSYHDAAFTVLKYKHPEATKTFGLVGKNVIFDTGGISIKPSQNLHYMKSDMGGGTAVMGSFYALTKLRPTINIIAILPITDNAVDKEAYLPGDVIPSHSGKTIEVIDTDAEGRLTLADGLSFMFKNYNPDYLLDIATLTGSAVRALGYEAAAMHSVNDDFATTIHTLGEEIGQRTWRFPLWDEYLENLKSDVADLKNFSGQPVADVINSAKFLQQFTHNHPCWAHLDIAGVAFGNNAYSKDKSATGYGVRLLAELVMKFASK